MVMMDHLLQGCMHAYDYRAWPTTLLAWHGQLTDPFIIVLLRGQGTPWIGRIIVPELLHHEPIDPFHPFACQCHIPAVQEEENQPQQPRQSWSRLFVPIPTVWFHLAFPRPLLRWIKSPQTRSDGMQHALFVFNPVHYI